jgi:hypothetical protein
MYSRFFCTSVGRVAKTFVRKRVGGLGYGNIGDQDV